MHHCMGTRPFLVIKSNDFFEALIFYKAAFGAEVMQLQKKRKRGDSIISEAVLKIGAQEYVISNNGSSQDSDLTS